MFSYVIHYRRTPGLFKLEYFVSGKDAGEVALSSKTYIVYSAEDHKVSSKAAQKNKLPQNPKELYQSVLSDKQSRAVINSGFVNKSGVIKTYHMERSAFSYFYCKRRLLDDGIHTVPLDLTLYPALLEKEEKEQNSVFENE